MTVKEMRRWQRAAMREAKRTDLELRSQIRLSQTVALWEVAIQTRSLAGDGIRPRTAKRCQAKAGRR